MARKARILDFYKGTTQYGYSVKGREGRQYRRETDMGGYYNGSGRWISYPEPYFVVKLYVYGLCPPVKLVDIRDEALEASGRARIYESYVQAVRDANCGKKIDVYVYEDDEVELADIDDLVLDV